jgi:hypothetical protein
MNPMKNSLLIAVLIAAVATTSILLWLNKAESISYNDLKTVLTTTTATFGTLLGIITAGLMFTQGKFSELASELSEKSPDYLAEMLPHEKIQEIESHLLALRKTFAELQKGTTIAQEENLYERITAKASSMFVNFAVLLNLKLRQQGLPNTGVLISEMDPQLYQLYQNQTKSIKKEWQVLVTIKQITDLWEAPAAFLTEKSIMKTTLQADLKSSVSVLNLKEKIDKGSTGIRTEVTKTLSDLGNEISKISRRLHEDRVPQLLSQMEHAHAIRGKYFYLTLIFIASPLFLNLLVLPQLSETATMLLRLVISVTSTLSVIGVIFLLLYIHKILNA